MKHRATLCCVRLKTKIYASTTVCFGLSDWVTHAYACDHTGGNGIIGCTAENNLLPCGGQSKLILF